MSIKCLSTGDFHININATRLGKISTAPLVREQRLKILKFVIETGVEEKADIIVIGGDIFDKAQPYPQDYDDLIKLLDDVPSTISVMLINGNHDEFTSKGCGLQAIAERRSNIIVQLQNPDLDKTGFGYRFIYAPWGSSIDAIKTLRDKIKSPPILILHGGVKSPDKHWVELEGEEGNYHLQDLIDLDCKAVMLGHFHGQKELAPGIWYSGSPDNVHGFSEEGDAKGFLIWDIDKDVKVTPVHTNPDISFWKTTSPEEFLLDMKEFSGYLRVKGEVTDKERLDIIKKLNDFSCVDFKLDLTTKTKKNRVRALKGKNEQEVLSNYFREKDIKNAKELLKLDKEIRV